MLQNSYSFNNIIYVAWSDFGLGQKDNIIYDTQWNHNIPVLESYTNNNTLYLDGSHKL